MRSLDDVEVGAAVPFDDDRAVIEDGDVPADHGSPRGSGVGAPSQIDRFLPERQLAAGDLPAREGVVRMPLRIRVQADVTGWSELAGLSSEDAMTQYIEKVRALGS